MPHLYPFENCSFCAKNRAQVKNLIAGPMVFICDECVEAATDIIREQDIARATRLKQDKTQDTA